MRLKLKYRHLETLALSLIFSGFYVGGRMAVHATALFVLLLIVGYFLQGGQSLRQFNKALLLPLLLYAFYLLSFTVSEHMPEARFDLQQKMALVAFPLFLGFRKRYDTGELQHVFFLFVVTSLFASLIILTHVLISYINYHKLLTYTSLVKNVHVSYLSAYLTINLLFVFYLLKTMKHKAERSVLLLSVLLSIPVVFLARSKAGMLIFSLVFVLGLYHLIREKSPRVGRVSLVVLIFSVFLFVGLNPRFRVVMNKVARYREVLNGKDRAVESTAERMMAWDAALQLIKEHPWRGMGNGDARIDLQAKYRELGYVKNARLRLNAHNQYLETWLATGLPGVLALLLLFVPLLRLQGEASRVAKGFLLVFALHFLFESMLNAQAGIMPFMFFYSLFLQHKA